ncbi:hypothetical protein IRJ41_015184 [Triplophysa rosa]|uniref:Uncharacterized protein n=1 Tax=Triplophysa rosa TaxID=992332 RepID=A0A9W7TK71_TRIRA|nr:hypothetical protein IRJ41_015184 [Triplophysa rosa]
MIALTLCVRWIEIPALMVCLGDSWSCKDGVGRSPRLLDRPESPGLHMLDSGKVAIDITSNLHILMSNVATLAISPHPDPNTSTSLLQHCCLCCQVGTSHQEYLKADITQSFSTHWKETMGRQFQQRGMGASQTRESKRKPS